MSAWGDEQIRARIFHLIAAAEIYTFQARRFDRLYNEPEDRHSWDLPWSFARLMHEGLTVVPAVNLISNLGNLDGRGLPPAHPLASLRAAPMALPVRFRSTVSVDREYDKQHVRQIYEWWQTPSEARADPPRMHRRIAGKVKQGIVHALNRAGR